MSTTPYTHDEARALLCREILMSLEMTHELPTLQGIAGFVDDLKMFSNVTLDLADAVQATKSAVKEYTHSQTQHELAIMAAQVQAMGKALATGQQAHADTYRERIVKGLARIDALLAQQAPFIA